MLNSRFTQLLCLLPGRDRGDPALGPAVPGDRGFRTRPLSPGDNNIPVPQEGLRGGYAPMKSRHHLAAVALGLAFLLSTWVPARAAHVDVTDLELEGGILTVNAVLDGESGVLMAAGFEITFPADRLQFLEAGSVGGVLLQALAEGCTLRLGMTVTGEGKRRIVVPLHFRVTGAGPYLAAVDPASLTDDLAGAPGGRPGIQGTAGLETPACWSVADRTANLFLIIPRVSQVSSLVLEFGGTDILPALLTVSPWYFDQIQDLAFLVLPGIALQDGVYPLKGMTGYPEGTTPLAAEVEVR